jgi:hypothetical protein
LLAVGLLHPALNASGCCPDWLACSLRNWSRPRPLCRLLCQDFGFVCCDSREPSRAAGSRLRRDPRTVVMDPVPHATALNARPLPHCHWCGHQRQWTGRDRGDALSRAR